MQFTNHTGMNGDADKVIATLQIQLATCFDLYSQVKQAHWNLRGPSFIGIHKMFDDLAKELESFTDDIAERIGALGGYAMGYVSAAAVSSQLDNPADDLVQDIDWIAFVLDQYNTYSHLLYTDIDTMGEVDPATEDLLIEIVRSIDKGIYFLAGHLDNEDQVEEDNPDDDADEFIDDGTDSTL